MPSVSLSGGLALDGMIATVLPGTRLVPAAAVPVLRVDVGGGGERSSGCRAQSNSDVAG